MAQMNGFRDLIVYRKAHKLASEIFEITQSFPKEEKYLDIKTYEEILNEYNEVRKMHISMMNNPDKF